MKKLLALLIGVCLIVPVADASAKAVKLGRGKTVSSGLSGKVGGKTSIGETEKKCDPSCATCDPKTGKCLTCPANMRLEDGKCYNVCSGVSCISSNYTPNVTDKGCCCERITCPSGQRLSNGTCVNICSGVQCATGYIPTASGNQCCCESSCGTNKVYNTTIGKCVDMICPTGCAEMCVNGCSACETGRYGLRQRQMSVLLRPNRELREMHVQGRNADRNVRDLHGVRGRLHAVGRQMRGVLPDGMFVVFFVHDLHGVRQRLLPQQRVMRRLSGKRDLRRWNGNVHLQFRIQKIRQILRSLCFEKTDRRRLRWHQLNPDLLPGRPSPLTQRVLPARPCR